jgi:hypothetical protein
MLKTNGREFTCARGMWSYCYISKILNCFFVRSPFLNDIDDVEKHLPGTLSAIREWFRTYKIPDGKPPVSLLLQMFVSFKTNLKQFSSFHYLRMYLG